MYIYWRIRDWEFRLSLSKSGVLNQKKEWGMGLGDENSPLCFDGGVVCCFEIVFSTAENLPIIVVLLQDRPHTLVSEVLLSVQLLDIRLCRYCNLAI